MSHSTFFYFSHPVCGCCIFIWNKCSFHIACLQLLCKLFIESYLVHEVIPSQSQEFHPRDQVLHPTTTEVLTGQEYNQATRLLQQNGILATKMWFCVQAAQFITSMCCCKVMDIYTYTEVCHMCPVYTIHYFSHLNIFSLNKN